MDSIVMQIQPPLKDSNLEMAPPPAASRDKDLREKSSGGRANEYEVVLDKCAGKRMGIDVDHKDGKTLLIECINEGLVKEWNETAPPGQKVAINDRITEVWVLLAGKAASLASAAEQQKLRVQAFADQPLLRLAMFDAGARMLAPSMMAAEAALAKVE
eukprot:s148_g4.t1